MGLLAGTVTLVTGAARGQGGADAVTPARPGASAVTGQAVVVDAGPSVLPGFDPAPVLP